MKQNNAAVTYTEVNQIIGDSGYGGTKCVTKDILSNNWVVDSSKLTGYQNNQLIKYQDISAPIELPTPVFNVPLISNQLTDLSGRISLPIPGTDTCYFDSSNGAWFIDGYKLEWTLSSKLDISKGVTFSIWLKRYSSSLGGKELSLTSDGDQSKWWSEDFGIQPYNANNGQWRGVYPTLSGFAGHCKKITDLNWHHYVGTVSAPNGNTVVGKMYLDGVLGETGTGTNGDIINAPLTKARLGYTYSYDSFVGWYKKAKIFNSELTAAQVQLLWKE